MATRCKDWMIELWNEAPWYFWVYIVMAGLQLFFDGIIYAFCTIASAITFAFLLKQRGMLRKHYVYVIVWPAGICAYFLIEAILGESLHIFFMRTFTHVHYYYIYNVAIQALVSMLLTLPFVALYEKDLTRTVIISTCLFCMITSCYVFIIFIIGMISLIFFNSY